MDCIEKLLQRTDESEELPVASASGGVYHLNSLPSIWDNTFIAQELLHIVEEHELQSLESWHLRIFFAALSGAVYQVSYGLVLLQYGILTVKYMI